MKNNFPPDDSKEFRKIIIRVFIIMIVIVGLTLIGLAIFDSIYNNKD